jgi:hypothetical protein
VPGLDAIGVGREELVPHVFGRHSPRLERVARELHQLERSAQEPLVDRLGADQHVEHRLELLGIDAAREDRGGALLTREHVVQGEP